MNMLGTRTIGKAAWEGGEVISDYTYRVLTSFDKETLKPWHGTRRSRT